jgi:hypothetical protein
MSSTFKLLIDRSYLQCHAYTTTRTKELMEKNNLRRAPHPPFSPDLALPTSFVLLSERQIAVE